MGSLFGDLPQSSQNKRRKIGYGNRYKASLPAEKGFKLPPKVETIQSAAPAAFNTVSELPTKDVATITRASRLNAIPDLPPKFHNSSDSPAVFYPPSSIPGPSSASTVTSCLSQTFDLPQTSDKPSDQRSSRSSSLSSLSSADSIELDFIAQIDRPGTISKPDHNTSARCPLCSAPVPHSTLEEFNFGQRMNLRAQQKFCQQHKSLDALASFKRLGYPTVEWHELEQVRIPAHVDHLNKVLSRKVPSYYRIKLENAAATDNPRKGIQKYLKQGFADVVKTGYYGLRGTRVFTHAITTLMIDGLRQALRKDKLIRDVEVGGFVNVVLVPELTLRLVMEDMGWLDDATKIEEGLKILQESEGIGRDLWGDADVDEKVVVRDE